ncbi:hypothetical protein HZC07_04510, partial [Candidatus Micrarchaeota archaeon]|nr:hypothetical protein [Candidatus Micrarchaeota archaeon]
MRNKSTIIIFIVLAIIFFAGCVQPIKNLGCCLRANASDPTNPGCALYNTTDYTTRDLISATVSGNCTAMVCGSFQYKPRVAPGFATQEEALNSTPSADESGQQLEFYKAQCRFLPMDARLKQIMKTSNSQINVFRIGVGGSFDEFDQYKDYFPISDKFCNLNPVFPGGSQLRVDRYMNYLASDNSTYNPNRITQNCLDDNVARVNFGTNNPFGFSETSAPRQTFFGLLIYNPINPDRTGYKYSYERRVDLNSAWKSDFDFRGTEQGVYTYPSGNVLSSIYKKIDSDFYRTQLSTTYASTIYGVRGATTRAPFECDASSNDCYSGSCDTKTYSRGVLLQPGQAGQQQEVVTDCNSYTDPDGLKQIVCAP